MGTSTCTHQTIRHLSTLMRKDLPIRNVLMIVPWKKWRIRNVNRLALFHAIQEGSKTHDDSIEEHRSNIVCKGPVIEAVRRFQDDTKKREQGDPSPWSGHHATFNLRRQENKEKEFWSECREGKVIPITFRATRDSCGSSHPFAETHASRTGNVARRREVMGNAKTGQPYSLLKNPTDGCSQKNQ